MAHRADKEYPRLVSDSSSDPDDEPTAAIPKKTKATSELLDADDISVEIPESFDERLFENTLFDDAPEADGAADADGEREDDEALPVGTVLRERFEIVGLVHSGGMGHIYKAVDGRRQEAGSEQIHVAIKTIRPSVAKQMDAGHALEMEAAKAQRLSHPNIVSVHDFDRHGDQFYLVMEWLEGESLLALLKRTRGRRLTPQFAWQVVQGIASGLQHAHLHDVIHADIKPSNVFITDVQEVKLLDFGIAVCSGDAAAPGHDVFWATQKYASPEVLEGSTPTFEDDIFSLGCVAYRLLAGHHPFEGRNSLEAERAQMKPAPIPGLDERHWQPLTHALAFRRPARPNTVCDFLVDFAANPQADIRPRWGWLGQPEKSLAIMLPLFVVAAAFAVWGLLKDSEFSPDPSPAIATTGGTDTDQRGGSPEQPAAQPVQSGLPERSDVAILLERAAAALASDQLTDPVDGSAHALFLEVLAIEPTNAAALRGIRAVSDRYAQSAEDALQSNDIAAAAEALQMARETDPDNPAIRVIDKLMTARSERLVTEARLAVADGDSERALALLSRAERFDGVDTASIAAVRDQIAGRRRQQGMLQQLRTADEHIEAGRLVRPAENNAHELLLELHERYPNDVRVAGSMERLAGRLLTLAAFATAADRFTESNSLLAATRELGVLETEVEAAQTALDDAIEVRFAAAAAEQSVDTSRAASGAQDSGSSAEADAGADDSRAQEIEPAADPIDAPVRATVPAAPSMSAGTVANDSERAADSASARGNDSSRGADQAGEVAAASPTSRGGPAPRAAEPGPVLTSMSNLKLEQFVDPYFPQAARRRGLTGYVDLEFTVFADGSTGDIEVLDATPSNIFSSSAVDAVRKWRFASEETAFRTRVRLRFNTEQ